MMVPPRAEDLVPGAAPSPARPDDRIPALDGVRGFALVMVLLFHLSNLAGVPRDAVVDKVFQQFVDTGWIALDLFFVLSGFLITGILYDSKAGPRFFRNFYARRALRIFPAYYAFLIFAFFLLPLVQPMEHAANDAIAGDRGWFVSYLMNFRIGLDHAERADLGLTGHLWSLAVEEQFYFVWPFLVLLFRRTQLMAICGLAVLIAVGTRTTLVAMDVNHWLAFTLTPARIDCLAIGSFVALAMRSPSDFRALLRWLPWLAYVSAAVVFVFSVAHGQLYPFDGWSRILSHTAVGMVFALLIVRTVTARPGSRLERFLAQGSLIRLGTYSYVMYIVHLPIAWILYRRFDIGDSLPAVFGSHLPGVFLFMTAAFIPTLAVGWLSWNFYESRVLKLKRFFSYGHGPETSPAEAGHEPSPPAVQPGIAGAGELAGPGGAR